jgi:hypothetical protein
MGQGQSQGQAAGQQGAGGMHSGAGGGDPNSGSARQRGQVDLPANLPISAEDRSHLESVGQVIDAAVKQRRGGEPDEKLLKSVGMSDKQYGAFVEQYAQRFGKLRPMPERTARPGSAVRDAVAVPGQEGLQKGRGSEKQVGATGMEGLDRDELRELVQPGAEDVSPEYRKQVEAYLKLISQGQEALESPAPAPEPTPAPEGD